MGACSGSCAGAGDAHRDTVQFNLETPDADVFREHTRIYRSISSSLSPPTFQLQVLLSIPELTPNQVLAYIAPDSSRAPVDPTPRYILLEAWSIEFVPHQQAQLQYGEERADVAPPTIYKHGISLFRSIFTLLRILPSWKLARRLRRPAGGNFNIVVRVEGGEMGALNGVLGFGEQHSRMTAASKSSRGALESLVQNSRLPQDTHEFTAVPHPMGSLSVSVTYLTSPTFQVVDRESLLSSRFLSQDEGPEFIPTLVKNKQRESLTSSPGSLPLRTSLPRSPPRSIADQFVLPPAHTRTISLSGGSPRPLVAQALSRAASTTGGAGAGSISGLSDASSVKHGTPSAGSREDLTPSALAARLRRESLGMGRAVRTLERNHSPGADRCAGFTKPSPHTAPTTKPREAFQVWYIVLRIAFSPFSISIIAPAIALEYQCWRPLFTL